MKKLIRKIHLWLSIPVGILITIACVTGAILVFEKEILELCYPQRYYVGDIPPGEPIQLNELIEIVNGKLEKDTLRAVQIFSDTRRTYAGTLASGHRSFVYFNQYTGEITGYHNTRTGFFSTIMKLHRWLLDPKMKTGRTVMGTATVCMVFILVSGIIVWWPKKKNLKSYFTIKKGTGFVRKVLDFHRVLGVYAAVFLLMLCLTGLMWSFEWYRKGAGKLFGVEQAASVQNRGQGRGQRSQSLQSKPEQTVSRVVVHSEIKANGEIRGEVGDSIKIEGEGIADRRAGNRDTQAGKKEVAAVRTDRHLGNREGNFPGGIHSINWQSIYDTAIEKLPAPKWIRIDNQGKITILPNTAVHPRANDIYRYDYTNRDLTVVSSYGDVKDMSYLMTWAYALHVGTWGGMTTRILTFIAALMGASLPITGYIIWIRKLIRIRKR